MYTEALDLLKITICDFMPRFQMQKNVPTIAATTVEPLLAKLAGSVCQTLLSSHSTFRTSAPLMRPSKFSRKSLTVVKRYIDRFFLKLFAVIKKLSATRDESVDQWEQVRKGQGRTDLPRDEPVQRTESASVSRFFHQYREGSGDWLRKPSEDLQSSA